MVEAGIGKDGQGSHRGEDDKDPQEHAVDHHGHILPVLFQLDETRERGRMDGREGKDKIKKKSILFYRSAV